MIIQLRQVLEALVLDAEDLVDVNSTQLLGEFLHDNYHLRVNFDIYFNILLTWTVPFQSSWVVTILAVHLPYMCVP